MPTPQGTCNWEEKRNEEIILKNPFSFQNQYESKVCAVLELLLVTKNYFEYITLNILCLKIWNTPKTGHVKEM